MQSSRKNIILAESSRQIGQIGHTFVLELNARIREIAALTRTLAAAANCLPKSETLYTQVISGILEFDGDLSIAGGGVWPEPYAFDSHQERRSFFWGRDAAGVLQYYNDYNQSELGYHQEAWYAVGRYINAPRSLWSASYLDPYSQQPMVTCTSAIANANNFAGVVTVDLKLEGLQALVETWQKETGGYIFILDHRNRFITFPKLDWVKTFRSNAQKVAENPKAVIDSFMVVTELADQQPLFLPLATALEDMNQVILQQAERLTHYQGAIAQQLSQESYQIDSSEAAMVAAVLADPFASAGLSNEDGFNTYLYKTFEIEDDILTQEPSTVFLFHVPQIYWKVVIVKPFSEAALATYKIIQAEKMSSLGQIVAGFAHEINNPINFIYGNITYANTYIQDLLKLMKLYTEHYGETPAEIQAYMQDMEFDFIISDLPKILDSMQVGADRVRQLVLSLRNFSRMDEAEIKTVDIHEGLNNTLLLINSRLNPSLNSPGIQIIKEYGELPAVECYPASLNQVFMNLLVNALDALDEFAGKHSSDIFVPKIVIRTAVISCDRVLISVADNGSGISESIQKKLFDPFFTTKAVGKGTGLGLSICYQIVTERHQGQLRCIPSPEQGTEFQIEIPSRQTP